MFNIIINKLSHYLINNLGFAKREDGVLTKTLSTEEYTLTPYGAYMIMSGKAFKSLTREEALTQTIIEDYISDVIMDRGLDAIEWTEDERSFFSCSNPEADECESDEAYERWCEIEEWVSSQNISTNHEEMMRYAAEIAERYTYQGVISQKQNQ